MTLKSEKSIRLERTALLLAGGKDHQEIWKELAVSKSTFYRDVASLGKSERKPMKRKDYVYAIEFYKYKCKRKDIQTDINEISDMIKEGKDEMGYRDYARMMYALLRAKKMRDDLDRNLQDWMFRAGFLEEKKEIEGTIKVIFPTTKKFEEGKDGKDN